MTNLWSSLTSDQIDSAVMVEPPEVIIEGWWLLAKHTTAGKNGKPITIWKKIDRITESMFPSNHKSA